MQITEDQLTDLMEEIPPVEFVPMDGADSRSEFEEQSMHEIIADDSCIPALDVLGREEILSLLAERMSELPDMSKKVLAMYYYENMPLSDIAACFRLTESRICQIHTQTIGLLRNYLVSFFA
jgi:RNA polymerase sigma factor FliA